MGSVHKLYNHSTTFSPHVTMQMEPLSNGHYKTFVYIWSCLSLTVLYVVQSIGMYDNSLSLIWRDFVYSLTGESFTRSRMA